jgi:hypothetical protein
MIEQSGIAAGLADDQVPRQGTIGETAGRQHQG